MRRDQKLVSLWLEETNQVSGTGYAVTCWEDRDVRDRPAVEAIATDSKGRLLAIEHTLVQPFVREKEDTFRFMTAIEPLDKDPTLVVPGYLIRASVRIGSIPKGIDWSSLAGLLRQALQQKVAALPEGGSLVPITALGVALDVVIDKMALKGEGKFLVSRILPAPSLIEVVRTVLERKLPKLTRSQADVRVLLLEQEQSVDSPVSIREAVDALAPDFPNLSDVNEIWLAITSCWETEGILWFHEVMPDLGGRRFTVHNRLE
jgi:hypothetical protein